MWDDVLKMMDVSVTPQKAVALWGGDVASMVLVSEGINFIYRFDLAGEAVYLRLTHQRLRPLSEMQAAMQYQLHCSQSGVPVCPLVVSRDMRYIEQIEQGEHVFLAHVCGAVPGQPISFNEPNDELYCQWGRSLAQLHFAAVSFRSDQFEYGNWNEEAIELKSYIDNNDVVIKNELETVIRYFHDLPKTEFNFGLIHGDHRKGNVLNDGQKIHFIDFDLPRYYWFMDDVARPFFSSILQKQTHWENKLYPYLKGYSSISQLSREDIGLFTWFLRIKALNIYLWTKNNWKGDIAPGGMKTAQWLALLSDFIRNPSWLSSVQCVVDDAITKLGV